MLTYTNDYVLNTRELFNLTGIEAVPLGNVGIGHVKTDTLKAWILKDLKVNLNLNNLNNTSDIDKPISKAQKLYIDSNFNGVYTHLSNLTTYVSTLENRVEALETFIANNF